jgi:uncharacterized protein (DUF1800 family)
MSTILAGAVRRKTAAALTVAEAARLIRQATLGIRSYTELTDIQTAGTRREQWIDAQLAIAYPACITTTKADGVTPFVETLRNMGSPQYGTAKATVGWGSYQDGRRLAQTHRMLNHPDRLRVKVVRCLTEYFSVGDTADGSSADGGTYIADILSERAFGTFKDLLLTVTRTLEMGNWLTFVNNKKASGIQSPDENYAREIMQLYTIGLWELNLDGTRKRYQDLPTGDSRFLAAGTAGSTAEVPTYGQDDIRQLARVFTGIGSTFPSEVIGFDKNIDYTPAIGFHEFGAKTALYGTQTPWINVPASATTTVAVADAELDYVIGRLVSHASCAPFFCKRMIEMMVTSNPSAGYVARVASVFVNDGTGQIGNLAAVFKAILMDQDARAPASKGLIGRVSHLYDIGQQLAQVCPGTTDTSGNLNWRLANFTSYQWRRVPLWSSETYDNEPVKQKFGIRSMRSVFGRIPARFSPVGPLQTAGLSSPESFLLDEYGATLLHNMDDGGAKRIRPSELAYGTGEWSTLTSGLSASNGPLATLIDKYCVLFTGDTAPQTFKDSLRTIYSNATNYPIATDQNKMDLFSSMVTSIIVSPYGMVRT